MVFNKMDSIKCVESDDKFWDENPTKKFCHHINASNANLEHFRTLFFLKGRKREVNSQPDVSQLAEGGVFQHKLSYEALKFIYPKNCPTKH